MKLWERSSFGESKKKSLKIENLLKVKFWTRAPLGPNFLILAE